MRSRCPIGDPWPKTSYAPYSPIIQVTFAALIEPIGVIHVDAETDDWDGLDWLGVFDSTTEEEAAISARLFPDGHTPLRSHRTAQDLIAGIADQ